MVSLLWIYFLNLFPHNVFLCLVYMLLPHFGQIGGNGRIRYEVRSTVTGGTPIEAVNTYIRHKNTHTMFEAKWMLVAKW